jgi:hypothetical protein
MSFTQSYSSSQPSSDFSHDSNLLHMSVRNCFATFTSNSQSKVNLFTTNTTNLFQIFLDALPSGLHQRHNCSKCRKFVDKYGGIVTIDRDGKAIPVMWNPEIVPEIYQPAIHKLFSAIAGAAIDNVFLTDKHIWGTPLTGIRKHLSVIPSVDLVFEPAKIYSIEQIMAEKRQDYEILLRGLAEFPLSVVKQARTLLSTETLYRSEKCIGVANWLLELQERRQSAPNPRLRDNLTWLAVANAPAGFCHIRSSMIGTLLEDIRDGLPFADIEARFQAKMNPLQYQRPSAPPSAGNIAQAEKIIAQLQTAGALERRFAKLEDLQALWLPQSPTAKIEPTGIFGHLKTSLTKNSPQIDIPPIVITWVKFARTILPTAKSIEYFVPETRQPYVAMVTAKNPEAPPIIQWDLEDCRNPVSWYFMGKNPLPGEWNLGANSYCPVTAIVLQPSMWHHPQKFIHQGEGVFFILKNAKDKEHTQGSGLFPEILKHEYYPIRSTLEAYSQNAAIEGKDEATACGIGLSKNGSAQPVFRVTNQDHLRVIYKIDRWD